jgi:hypothetical protein
MEKLLFHSGDLFLPSHVRTFLEQYWIGNDTSIFYVSWWTFIHVMSGMIAGLYFSYMNGFLLHSAWEVWQIIGKNTKYWTLRGQVDILVDTVAYMIGMYAVKR